MARGVVNRAVEGTHSDPGPWAMREEGQRRQVRAGLTGIELLVTGALLATLAVIVVPPFTNAQKKSRVTRAVAMIRSIEADLTVYITKYGRPPNTLLQAGIATPRDPWGHQYRYLKITGGGPRAVASSRKDYSMVPVNTTYDLYSMGPDGDSRPAFAARASRDDIVRAADGAYVGPVSEF